MINTNKLIEICYKHGVEVIDDTNKQYKHTYPNMTAREQANIIHWEWKLAMSTVGEGMGL